MSESSKPCPSCGHCPTCGRGPTFVYPIPYYIYPTTNPIPIRPWWYGGTSVDTTGTYTTFITSGPDSSLPIMS